MNRDQYYRQRITETLGLPDSYLHIQMQTYGPAEPGSVIGGHRPVVTYDNKTGDLLIIVTTIDRHLITYDVKKGKYGGQEDEYTIRRLTPERYSDRMAKYAAGEIKKEPGKYEMPKGQGTFPFFPPHLQEAYEKGTKLPYLAFTEGALKALKGDYHGMHVVGLSSITHMRQDGEMYADVVKLIERCKPDYLILLHDADARQISHKALTEKNDLRKRPYIFYSNVQAFHTATKGFGVPVYYKYIHEELMGEPKGLDDLLITHHEDVDGVSADFQRVDKVGTGKYFVNFDISINTSKVFTHFHLANAEDFYAFHQPHIANQEFVFHGSHYQWNEEKNALLQKIPAEAKDYVRIGPDYYKLIEKPDKHGHLERVLVPWKKPEIKEDIGKDAMQHIRKLEAFVNVPSHTDYSRVVNNCWNLYHPFTHEAEEGECPTTLSFLKHIFGAQLNLGLDYLTLLYKNPTQILPILCLVSQEKHTGKTTFANWLKMIFSYNMAIVGNKDLANDFNAHWVSKLIVCSDETFIEKKATMEYIKSLSTGDKIMMNDKGKSQTEVDIYMKFILLSNNEKNFINTDEDEIRFWVRKVPTIPADRYNNRMMEELHDEIPAFLYLLETQPLSVQQKKTRMWFDAKDLRTDALKVVVEHSRPTVEKELRACLMEYFLDHGLDEALLTLDNIKDIFRLQRYEKNYLTSVLKENLSVDTYHVVDGAGNKVYKTKKYTYHKWLSHYNSDKKQEEITRISVRATGRPYVFKRADFVPADMLSEMGEDDTDLPVEVAFTPTDRLPLDDDATPF